ncbi:RNA 2'-phosphotransferase [Chitinophaga nivalis]|uniref:Probable RNA 2'-phosphotransferase n=1 Tax=Chitinophaga nivalis TaxID=2991709 RepID=A0ABT3ILG8_9BACT|nr:RNA 2'-phosphotransferase [Chitinophaga nivalis]MCW3465501.1 RNA 2'-phosphotransferase [Chitinophaga nivalis]MCW3484808.1 RNA 2'-phosphotransferase [Chitinophaga nivalis]
MNDNQIKSISKFLSLILRHSPDTIRLQLDTHGWADVATLLRQCHAHGKRFSFAELEEVVRSNDKQRFEFNEDKTRIRANQGHSLNIETDLPVTAPPEFLYHGTVGRFVGAIRNSGLQKMNRQHVHLTADRHTAEQVGGRRGAPVVLSVRSGDMHRDGYTFFLSANNVWLTDAVPPQYIQ